MRMSKQRPSHNRRQSINDVEYFARGGEERRSGNAERRAYDQRYGIPERGDHAQFLRELNTGLLHPNGTD